ncbi:MAG: glycosyltransferase family 2 protein [Pelagimonas sp.]|nr:glycosyltransferase family 2 protein [Pelagimonas sp.]
MVHRDHWALSRWYAHHGHQLGAENLYIVAHGADPLIAQICPRATVITIPRDGFDNFDRKRAAMLDGFHSGLSQIYDWVIRCDADELICHDPLYYPSLAAAIYANAENPVLTALGFDLVEMPFDRPMTEGPVLTQRRHMAFSGHYSKAVASRRPIGFQLHGVRVAPKRLNSFPFAMPRGLFLAHLKYANKQALKDATQVRMQVAAQDAPGGPGAGWRAADEDATKFYETFMGKRTEPWEVSEKHAFDTLSIKPTRNEKFNIVKTRALKLDHRTELPDRFVGIG